MVNFDSFDLLMENNFQYKEVSATLIHCNKSSVLHHHCNYYVTGRLKFTLKSTNAESYMCVTLF